MERDSNKNCQVYLLNYPECCKICSAASIFMMLSHIVVYSDVTGIIATPQPRAQGATFCLKLNI
jgi:hypothetical protein